MATKKAVAKKTAVPAKKTVPTKAPAGAKAPVQKMTKTQLIRYMAEQMEAPPKQIAAFFDLLIETATTHTRKNRRVHDSGPGQAGEGATCSPDGPQPGDR